MADKPIALKEMPSPIADFHLPAYDRLPDMGLYLEQITRYINETLEPLGCIEITSSMISNYVKKGLIKRPLKKQYDAEQIAYLFFIAITKQVLSMEQISKLLHMQQQTYAIDTAYNYFCQELENVLQNIFHGTTEFKNYSNRNSLQKEMLRSTTIAVGHIIYLNYRFSDIPSPDEDKKETN